MDVGTEVVGEIEAMVVDGVSLMLMKFEVIACDDVFETSVVIAALVVEFNCEETLVVDVSCAIVVSKLCIDVLDCEALSVVL